MSSGPDTLSPWLHGHLLGIYASILGASAPETDEFRRARRELRRWFDGLASDHLLLDPPLSTLNLLEGVLQDPQVGTGLAAYAGGVREARLRLVHGLNPGAIEARIWAFHALFAGAAPRNLLRLGRVLFRSRRLGRRASKGKRQQRRWHRDGVEQRFSDLLPSLRDPHALTSERGEAATQIAACLMGIPGSAHIRNALHELLYAWPLLVVANGAAAVSVPVGVDVVFDGKRRLNIVPKSSDTLGVAGWYRFLDRAVVSARELWRSKHGNHGDFREEVDRLSVTFDFRLVEGLARQLNAAKLGGIRLEEGSAQAYLSQVVLSRILGRPATLSVATGGIGERCVGADGLGRLQHRIVAPQGVPEKLRYVFSARMFERVVLATSCVTDTTVQETIARAQEEGEQTAEVLYAHDTQALADIVQVHGWRQFQYVRCPDIAWTLHSERSGRTGLLEIEDVRVQGVMKRIRSAGCSVLTMNEDPMVVASALSHINTTIREAFTNPPPSLSWAFLRLVETEPDAVFWQVLAHVCGIADTDLASLVAGSDTSKVVARIGRMLNRFQPDRVSPFARAPDVVVLVGGRSPDRARRSSPASHVLDVDAVLERLSATSLLSPSPDGSRLIGRTRIVRLTDLESSTVATRGEGTRQKEAARRVTRDVAMAADLEELSIFEAGFTQHAAGRFFRLFRGGVVRGVRECILAPLVQNGSLRFGQGQYHIPRALHAAVCSDLAGEPPLRTAYRHFCAGSALAPYTASTDVMAVAMDTAVLPHVVSEARRHFMLAEELARQTGDQQLSNSCRRDLGHLLCFFAPLTWDTAAAIRRLGTRQEEAFEMHLALVEKAGPIHPAHLVSAGRSAAKLAYSYAMQGGGVASRASEVNAYALRWFREAFEALAAFPEERRDNELLVLSWLGNHLVRQEGADRNEIAQLWKRTTELLRLDANHESVCGEWFEQIADDLPDHVCAADIYAVGARMAPRWAPCFVKGLGAALLGGRNIAPFAEATENSVMFLSHCLRAQVRDGRAKSRNPAVHRRWERGTEFLKQFEYGGGNGVRRTTGR